MTETNFTWIETHYKIAEYLSTKENDQKGLIQLLKSIGVGPFRDKSMEGKEYDIDLEEIDPFTFFCYLHKYSSTRLTYIKALAKKIGVPEPQDNNGLPTANAQRVWMFPPKYQRTNNEIARLWDFFRKARNGNLSDKEFKDVLTIKNVAITKLTESLFYIDPKNNLPINNPIQSYLKTEFGIDPKIKTYSDYTSLLEEIKAKINLPFYQISHDAWVWKEANNGTPNPPKPDEVSEPAEEQESSDEKKKQLDYSLNTIFYGPPGTGKTYHSLKRAAEIVAGRKLDSYDEAIKIYKENLHDTIELITFHQNYSYEDFVQGLRPDVENDSHLTFERKDGIFKVMADRALKNLKDYHEPEKRKKTFEEALKQFILPLEESEKEEIEMKMKKVSYFITAASDKAIDFRKASGGTAHKLSLSTLRKMYDEESTLGMKGLLGYYDPLLEELLKIGKDSSAKKQEVVKKNYVLIIDEINRANISRVFGELITLIEEDKRSHGKRPMELILPSGDKFIVPSNLYIIGTMNTADKSIALLDIALRRRFDFEPMFPVYAIEGAIIHDTDVLLKLNEGIIKTKGYDFQIGHAYFMDEENNLIKRMNRKVIPLLLEYYMNDEREVKALLQNAGLIVDEDKWPLQISGRKE
ncbi:MAG: AAA family ATPase [Porphyromonadaceae bacterium]|nr:AAA family ATPase [Porphyromonadaceae bacterium]